MKKFIVLLAATFLATGCTLFETHDWIPNRETYTLEYYINKNLADSYELNSFKLVEGQNLVYKEVITMDNPFHSTECFLSKKRLEEVDSWCWKSSYEVKKVKYQGFYVYAIGGVFSQTIWKTASFDFYAEEVWEKDSGRLILGLPPMRILKTGETIQEELPTKEGEIRHVLLKMQLSVFRENDGKLISDLPIVFDVTQTNETIWNDQNGDITIEVEYDYQGPVP